MIDFIDTNLSTKLDAKVVNDLREACERRRRYFKSNLNPNSQPSVEEMEIAKHMHQYFEGEAALISHQRELLKHAHQENSYSDEIIRKIEHDLDAFSLVVQARRSNSTNQ